jgi:hypothetical protein
VRIPLLPATTISATVTLEGTEPEHSTTTMSWTRTSYAPGVKGRPTTVVQQGISLANVHLSRAGTLLEGDDLWLNAGKTAQDNQDISPGHYSVEITPTDSDWYVQSAESGGADLLREDLVVTPGTQPGPIHIVLRNDGAHLSGSVQSDGEPVPVSAKKAYTVVVASDRDPSHPKTALAGPDGRFQITNVPPGNCSVLAFDESSNLEYANPEVLAQYLSQATRLTLAPNQDAGTTVNLVHTGQ